MSKSLLTTDPEAGIYSTIEVVVFNGAGALCVERPGRVVISPNMVKLGLSRDLFEAHILDFGTVLALTLKSDLPSHLKHVSPHISVGKRVRVVPSQLKATIKES